MSCQAAIFNTQNEAIQAIEALEQAGFTRTEIKVIAKDREHSRRIETETNVHADELQDLQDTRSAMDEHGTDDIRVMAPLAATPGINMAGGFTGGMAYPGNSLIAASVFLDDDNGVSSALHDLGLGSGDFEPCREALARGAIIVAVDVGSSQPGEGPDLTPRGTAEAVFRSCNAVRIL
ncbi:general stress protein [Paenibacillus sp. R14(2021)]|uniref:general stress protein n=1 Tax=Paenibacillus sp. R14(2021) TaxID=2859228 RepID=UPI001C6124BD|nr:general stress protein [Paenibacillus sp. R14(2021)]